MTRYITYSKFMVRAIISSTRCALVSIILLLSTETKVNIKNTKVAISITARDIVDILKDKLVLLIKVYPLCFNVVFGCSGCSLVKVHLGCNDCATTN